MKQSRWFRVLIVLGAFALALAAGALYPWLARGVELGGARWQSPWALLALLLVPPLLWRATLGEDARLPRLRVGSLDALAAGPRGLRAWLADVPGALRGAALVFGVIALARPLDPLRATSKDERGIDIVIVLDLSGSMEAVLDNLPPDLERYVEKKPRGERPTRLDGAKAVIRDLISHRKSDRIGVVVFGKDAYVVSPPTLDYHLLDVLVSRMQLKLIDDSATAIGDAVGVAVARLRKSDARSRAVILLTDGDNNSGQVDPDYAAHLATTVGVRLYTVQIGSGEKAEVFEGHDFFGQPRYSQRKIPTNPELLARLAQKTGGSSYVATDATALRASLQDVLDRLEKTQFSASAQTYEELFRFFLLPAVLLVALDVGLRAFWLRRFP